MKFVDLFFIVVPFPVWFHFHLGYYRRPFFFVLSSTSNFLVSSTFVLYSTHLPFFPSSLHNTISSILQSIHLSIPPTSLSISSPQLFILSTILAPIRLFIYPSDSSTLVSSPASFLLSQQFLSLTNRTVSYSLTNCMISYEEQCLFVLPSFLPFFFPSFLPSALPSFLPPFLSSFFPSLLSSFRRPCSGVAALRRHINYRNYYYYYSSLSSFIISFLPTFLLSVLVSFFPICPPYLLPSFHYSIVFFILLSLCVPLCLSLCLSWSSIPPSNPASILSLVTDNS